MRFFLAYVNLSNGREHAGREFETLTMLMEWVNEEYANWSSYGITVLKVNPPQAERVEQ